MAILDADKEGFLRSASSLIQTMGRAARNVDGTVVLYADTITDSMREAVSVTQRRREIQIAYNMEHGIDPQTIRKSVTDILERLRGTGGGGAAGRAQPGRGAQDAAVRGNQRPALRRTGRAGPTRPRSPAHEPRTRCELRDGRAARWRGGTSAGEPSCASRRRRSCGRRCAGRPRCRVGLTRPAARGQTVRLQRAPAPTGPVR